MPEQDVLDQLLTGADVSPLATLIGGEPSSDPLLQQAEAGKFDTTTHPTLSEPGKGFDWAVNQGREILARQGQQELEQEREAQPEAEAAPDEAQEDHTTSQPADPQPEAAPELPPYFHTLNEQAQQVQRRAEALEQKLLESQRQTQAYIQQLTQPRRPDEAEARYADEGFESPEQYREYHAKLNAQIDQRARQATEPILAELAQQKFNNAVQSLSNDPETAHFSRYFDNTQLSQFFQQITRQFGVGYVSQVDWHSELSKAYRNADYPRLARLEAERERKETAMQEAKKAERANDKVALRAVPKASATGTQPVKSGAPQEAPKFKSFQDLADYSKKQYGLV